ncbi:hypothetical protein WR25_17014 [Diploscapter pachys]|uniref:Uncharacterized protein n=1 Tax=Diploscapter pachys TaxID=2018661 RepID=A0A2A2L097_9BILA|nr:hypothetical protein WR25_17014 [Diploscapter pachys]
MDCIFSCETLDRSYPVNKNDTNKSAEHDIFDRFRNQRVKVHYRYHYYSEKVLVRSQRPARVDDDHTVGGQLHFRRPSVHHGIPPLHD